MKLVTTIIYSKVLSVLGLRCCQMASSVAEDSKDIVGNYVHVTQVENLMPAYHEYSGEQIIMALTARVAITLCVQVYIEFVLLESDAWFHFLRESFSTFSPQSQEHNTIYFMKAFFAVLAMLLGGSDWVTTEDTNFEIHPAVWALRLSPLPLASGLVQGKTAHDIFLNAENKCVGESSDDINYEEKKAALREFAAKLAAWAAKVLNAA
ncbi:hypothetical protein DE146DRAFT_789599 [Phaeosphaeria sp. MPI-PUGE-AT-0046c]|nr:hypothetical protein DE146DRAFT_789599 [Phaeosphaeria sp. MPI-PUGE-AT-0046c]